MPEELKRVAVLTTEYRRHSHSDIIAGKILEGYGHQGKHFPRLRIASMYVDQFPKADTSRALSQKYKFPIYDNIASCLTLGKDGVQVDGVLSIAEHGRYPTNRVGQLLYPRRRFFEEATRVMAKYRKPVPVFNDKHLGPTWNDAKWMYDRARELKIPLLAGSTIPLTWRRPPLQIPRNAPLVEAVQIGYGPLEGYGFHALEGLQCMVERRRGGETGVRSVQCLSGVEMWRAMDRGLFSRELLEAAMTRVSAHAKGDYRALTAHTHDSGVILIDYVDGFKAAMVVLNGWVYEGDGGAFTFAVRVRGQQKLLSHLFWLQNLDPFGHFAYQLRAFESMLSTGHAPFPVERTLLTSGILDAAMTSRTEKNRRLMTPHLAIRYEPTDWPFAQDPVPPLVKR